MGGGRESSICAYQRTGIAQGIAARRGNHAPAYRPDAIEIERMRREWRDEEMGKRV
jgi:hypothetical protein